MRTLLTSIVYLLSLSKADAQIISYIYVPYPSEMQTQSHLGFNANIGIKTSKDIHLSLGVHIGKSFVHSSGEIYSDTINHILLDPQEVNAPDFENNLWTLEYITQINNMGMDGSNYIFTLPLKLAYSKSVSSHFSISGIVSLGPVFTLSKHIHYDFKRTNTIYKPEVVEDLYHQFSLNYSAGISMNYHLSPQQMIGMEIMATKYYIEKNNDAIAPAVNVAYTYFLRS